MIVQQHLQNANIHKCPIVSDANMTDWLGLTPISGNAEGLSQHDPDCTRGRGDRGANGLNPEIG